MHTVHQQASEKPADRNIRVIASLEKALLHSRSRADRLAWAITRAVGSGMSVLLHVAWFGTWMWLNSPTLSGAPPFDPFPFPVLTMLVSVEVIFLSVIVLLNQNRMAIEADKRAHLNLQIDLLAERELTLILRMQRELAERLEIESPLSRELEELLKDTDLHDIATKLDRELPSD